MDITLLAIDDVSLQRAGNPITVPGRRKLTVTGDYYASDTATCDLTLAGAAKPGVDYAQLLVEGEAALNGTLSLTTASGYIPRVGDAFTLLTADSITGTFATPGGLVTASDGTVFEVSYSATTVTARAVRHGGTVVEIR